MAEEYKKFTLPDIGGTRSPMIVETDWNDSVAGRKAYRLRLGDEEIIIEGKYFESLFFMVGSEPMQDTILDLQSRQQEEMSEMVIPLLVKMTEDVKEGQYLKVRHKIHLPTKLKESYFNKFSYDQIGTPA